MYDKLYLPRRIGPLETIDCKKIIIAQLKQIGYSFFSHK